MGGFVSVIVCFIAAIAFYGTKHPVQFWLSVISTVVAFWSWGVMHNLAMNSARDRWKLLRENMIREGRSQEDLDRVDKTRIRITPDDLNKVPNGLSLFNMIVTFVGIALLIWGIITRLIR